MSLLLANYSSDDEDLPEEETPSSSATTLVAENLRQSNLETKRKLLLSAPVANYDDDEDDRNAKKRKQTPSSSTTPSSGLLSFLPAPKGSAVDTAGSDTTSRASQTVKTTPMPNAPMPMIPYALTKKAKAAVKKNAATVSAPTQSTNVVSVETDTEVEVEAEAEDDSSVSLFNLGGSAHPVTIPALAAVVAPPLPQLQHNDDVEDDVIGPYGAEDDVTGPYGDDAADVDVEENASNQHSADPYAVHQYGVTPLPVGEQATLVDSDAVLQFEPFKRKKTLRDQGNSFIVRTIDDTARMRDAEEFRQKMGPDALPAKTAFVGGGTAKKKHQLTWVAADTLARESEIKRLWATGHQNKAAGKKKYGF